MLWRIKFNHGLVEFFGDLSHASLLVFVVILEIIKESGGRSL
jgi:hypothetical protein